MSLTSLEIIFGNVDDEFFTNPLLTDSITVVNKHENYMSEILMSLLIKNTINFVTSSYVN